MKILPIFAALVAVAVSYPVLKSRSLFELSHVLETNQGDPAMRPYYTEALNTIMFDMYSGKNEKSNAILLSPSGNRTWTEDELKTAIQDPKTDVQLRSHLRSALHQLQEANKESTEVPIPALDISTWTVAEIKEAYENPNTKPALLQYLLKAIEEIEKALEEGKPKDHVTLVTPVGLVPVRSDYKHTFMPRH